MYDVVFVNNMSDFLEHTQIISLLQDQMEYIDSPKTNSELLETFKIVFREPNAHLMVISEHGSIVGFAFFNVCVGMESAGQYLWLNEMHVHKDYRSRGIGALLFNEIKKWCKENKIVRLMGMADQSELRTKKFYKTQGADIKLQDIISIKFE
jgi:GNAT superfamily N-acetyltransferase